VEVPHAASPLLNGAPPAAAEPAVAERAVGEPAAGGFLRRFAGRRLDAGSRLLVGLIREERRLFLLTVALTGVGAVLEGVGLGLLVPFLDGLLNPAAEAFRTGWGWFDTAVLAADAGVIPRLHRIAALMLASIWLRAVVSVGSVSASSSMQERILDRLRRRAVDRLQGVALSYYTRSRTGDLLNTLTGEVERLRSLFAIARMYLVNGTLGLAYAATLVAISWHLTLLALAFCGLMVLVLNGFLRKLRDSGRSLAESRGRVSAAAAELIGGIRTIVELGAQPYEAARFAEVSEAARRENVRTAMRSALVGPSSQALAATALVVMIVVAVQMLVLPGLMGTAALFAFLVVLIRLLPILQSVNTSRAEWAVFRGALDRVEALLRPDDKPFLRDGDRPLTRFADRIELDCVSFGYDAGQHVLNDVSLTIRRGETVAVVGASGSGKSTLADVVARFHDPTTGAIRLDGVDLRSYRLADLRRLVAVVSQHTFLFNDTVRANITYGLGDVPEERVRAAAEDADALEFIEALPEGFETQLGERGARLSGGQRQRIAIARALLRNPEILILDEATSALDSVAERQVQTSLERLMARRTVLVIAHRLSTVEGADRVVVLEEGAVVEEGPYAELLARRGHLWRYHAIQFQLPTSGAPEPALPEAPPLPL
jgi:subfamily B ATP-binding cassette protein MsbA